VSFVLAVAVGGAIVGLGLVVASLVGSGFGGF
jgi:hypothetical protein